MLPRLHLHQHNEETFILNVSATCHCQCIYFLQYLLLADRPWIPFLWLCLGDSKHLVKMVDLGRIFKKPTLTWSRRQGAFTFSILNQNRDFCRTWSPFSGVKGRLIDVHIIISNDKIHRIFFFWVTKSSTAWKLKTFTCLSMYTSFQMLHIHLKTVSSWIFN